jgi:dolichyl-phosphate-mannose-protein mannosyltransferase
MLEARGRATRRWTQPLVVLAAVSVLSLAGRVAFLGSPCHIPCTSASAHVLVFDEAYYVPAGRVIAGIDPPRGSHYHGSPAGDDPNSEHPQLAKVIIAGAIELFGDGPFAWRIASIVLGSLAILGMFVLVRAAGGGRWLAVGAASLMAADNLLLVHSRIATLDVYAVAAMIWGAALYLRGRPLLAGVVVGIGACAKEVAPYVLLALVLDERVQRGRTRETLGAQARRLGACIAAAAGTFVAVLALLDRIAPPYDPIARRLVGGGVFGHIRYILHYGQHQTSPHGPHGIASYPWDWLVDVKPIVYLNINPSRPVAGLLHVHPEAHFLGMISPVILLVGLPGLVAAGWSAAKRTRLPATDVELLGLAWFAGTFAPFVLLSLLESRTSYLYYMVAVMPGIYIAAAALISRVRPPPRVTVAWIVAIGVALVAMYPFTPVP